MRYGELFSGAGGFACGAKQAGWEHVWAVDNDPYACETYARNLGGNVICKSATEIDFNDLDPVDCLVFGFPCKSFSSLQWFRKKDKRVEGFDSPLGFLYKEAVRGLKVLKPKYFIAENVPALLNRDPETGKRKYATQIVRELSEAGYFVQFRIWKFFHYGVPQNRSRVIFAGVRTNNVLMPEFSPPPRTGPPVMAGEAFANIPDTACNHEKRPSRPEVIERLKMVEPGEQTGYRNPKLPDHLQVVSKARKLHPERLAPTVTMSDPRYHWDNRRITLRERARLQSFSDDFCFFGTRVSIGIQIGNAIPPLGAKVICEQFERQLVQ